jgi:hypothetical protein
MKNIKKLYFSTLLIAFVSALVFNSSAIYAQNSHFSIALSPVFPVSLKSNASFGILSGNISYRLDITNKISWKLTAGINKFGSKSVTAFGTNTQFDCNLAFIPITTGLQFYFKGEGTRGYFAANGGYYLPAADFEKGDWGFSSGLGIEIPMKNQKNKFDVSILYNAALGGTTKEYTLSNGNLSGSTTYTTEYTWASFISFNVGVVF